MPERVVRVHVENNRDAERALAVTPEHLTSSLGKYPGLADRVSVTFNDDPEQFANIAADAEVLFTGRKPKSLAFAKALRWVQSTSAGVEALLPILPSGAVLTNASGVHREKGGEFILAAVLMLNYAIPRFASDKVAKTWKPR